MKFGIPAVALLLPLFLTFSAQADLLCAKKSVKVKSGAIKFASALKTVSSASCPSGYSLIKDLSDSHDKNLLGFGRIAEDGSVTNFGGAGLTSVSATPLNTGDSFFQITLTGDFSGLSETDSASNRAKLSVLSSAYAFDYGVTNASVVSASATSIVLNIFIFRSFDHDAAFQKGLMFTVFKS